MIRITAGIEGMMCGMCEAHVQDAIRKAFPVRSVKASRARQNVVIVTETEITEAELRRVIDPTGYKVLSFTSEPWEKKGFRLFGKK